jgi:hypothetical protein
MSGAIPPLPQYAFMAWCSVKKAQGQLYLYLIGVDGRIILKLILKEQGKSMSTRFIWRALVETTMTLRVTYKIGNILTG